MFNHFNAEIVNNGGMRLYIIHHLAHLFISYSFDREYYLVWQVIIVKL